MASIGNITFACEDPVSLAAFWAETLDYEKETLPPEFIEQLEADGHDPDDGCPISDPTGEGPRLFFRRLPTSNPESIPIHLDINVPDREEAVDELVGRGATEVETKTFEVGPHQEIWTVMKDPEGNSFCVYPARE